jgi:glycosyltransferase involved in cell wall biosynthesis
MKVLMLLSNEYRPDPRVRKEAITLREAGHEVTVLCWNRPQLASDHLEDDGIKIERVRTGKVASPLSMGTNIPFFYIRAYFRSRHLEFDVVHCHDYDTLMLGVFISRLRHVPLVYDSHEWFSKMVAQDLPGFACRLIERTESLLMPNCQAVIAANEAVADHLVSSGANNVTVVMNCPDLPPDQPRAAYLEKDGISLFYGGTLEPGRFVKEMLEVVKGDKGCTLRIAGNGRMVKDVEEAAASCDCIHFLGYIAQDQIFENIAGCDAVVSMLDPSNGNYAIATPIKLLEAMAYGVPIIVSEGTYSAEMVKLFDCGLVVEYTSDGMSSAISLLKDAGNREKLGRNGRVAAEKEYNWAAMRERLWKVYRTLPYAK